ncbi:hypothetical protein AAFC00_000870 [Neodothiora populina]|uniref:RRM domain-containing protein n=1 Tax=Neodothiora populina TaxID=2781224 RepID=A0ABR3PM24_9PEZI
MGSKSKTTKSSKKQREASPASEAEDVKMQEPTTTTADSSPSASPEPSKKRKRSSKTATDAEEIEIDVTLPEPLSKAEARKAKKAKTKPAKEGTTDGEGATDASEKPGEGKGRVKTYGIWIGNLPFTADKTVVRVFFTRQGQIPDADITRVHMPTPQHAQQPGRVKPNNKGFAYIDFANEESLSKALALSESLMTGRKVLIKDANSYEGRPTQTTPGPTAAALSGTAVEDAAAAGTAATAADGAKPGKPVMAPSKRVFVGNLGFDVTKEDLEYHFGQAGEIEDIHMATFQDTGKCKGFAWVRFVELEAAQGAVQGYIFKEEPASDDEDEDEAEAEKAEASDSSSSDSDSDSDEEKPAKKPTKKTKKPKKRKWFINRLQGRPLRCEFAEDASTRYKKRFGKGGSKNPFSGDDNNNNSNGGEDAAAITEVGAESKPRTGRGKGTADERQAARRQKHIDARLIRPGAALANAPRASGGIVKSEGKKITFE